jgi:hypothetical protein
MPTREELERREKERLARIHAAARFPWMSIVLGVVSTAVILLVFGVSLFTLILVMIIVGIMSKGRISFFGPPG